MCPRPPGIARSSTAPRDESAADQVADRLHSLAIHLLRRLRKEDEASGLTPPRLSALSVVVFGGPITIGQLAQAEQVSAPTMTRLVAGMERDGLVRRKADAQDKRVVWIEATARGSRILQEGRRRRVSLLARHLQHLDAAQLALIADATEFLSMTLTHMSTGEET